MIGGSRDGIQIAAAWPDNYIKPRVSRTEASLADSLESGNDRSSWSYTESLSPCTAGASIAHVLDLYTWSLGDKYAETERVDERIPQLSTAEKGNLSLCFASSINPSGKKSLRCLCFPGTYIILVLRPGARVNRQGGNGGV